MITRRKIIGTSLGAAAVGGCGIIAGGQTGAMLALLIVGVCLLIYYR